MLALNNCPTRSRAARTDITYEDNAAKLFAFSMRFQREGQALAMPNHPNIGRVLDADHEDGRHFISMEFIDGGRSY